MDSLNLECPAGAGLSPNIPAADPAMPAMVRRAAFFVVVSRWTKARFNFSAPSYDVFETLADAREELRRLTDGEVSEFRPVGIFAASADGLPIGGALDVAAIEAVL